MEFIMKGGGPYSFFGLIFGKTKTCQFWFDKVIVVWEISIKKNYFESFISKCKCNYLPLKYKFVIISPWNINLLSSFFICKR